MLASWRRSLSVGCAALAVAGVVMLGCVCGSAVAAGDVNAASCRVAEGSPGFRGLLPDCRAYELVTPPYDAGAPAYGPVDGAPLVSGDGEHLVSEAFAGFCGTENSEYFESDVGAYYEYSRTASGWVCEALDPPASAYPRRLFFSASADVSRTLWGLQVPGHGGEEVSITEPTYDGWTLAVREAAGGDKGRFTLLGPVVAPGHESHLAEYDEAGAVPQYNVAGASADLSRVLISVKASHSQLWPGDMTVKDTEPNSLHAFESLYEYRAGGGDEPALVGVSNSGPLAGLPHINEGADLISECGIAANAISASGEVVLFTAHAADQGPESKHCNAAGEGTGPAVDELYARVGGSRTVDISEPSTGPGGDCESCDESEPKAAVYQGSSEDGSKVFFTTEQDLLPGAAGDSLYEYNFDVPAGRRVTLLSREVNSVAATASSGSLLYFQSNADLTGKPNANGEAASEVAGEKLYVCDAGGGSVAFVAGEVGGVQTTPDGRYVLFSSGRELKGTDDTSTVAQLFEYDTETEALARVSVGQKSAAGFECPDTHTVEEGYDCNGNTTDGADTPNIAFPSRVRSPADATSGLSLAENGVVVFSSALPLTPQAPQGRPFEAQGIVVSYTENVYEYRAGDVYLISPADEGSPLFRSDAQESRLFGVGESGRDVFFGTTDSLVPQDTDTQYSWYDAREEGGFPAPPATAGCAGEACQGPANTPLAVSTGVTNTLPAPGNLAPPVPARVVVKPVVKKPARCKKGFVRKKGKCVRNEKAKKAKKAKNAARAGSDRRASR